MQDQTHSNKTVSGLELLLTLLIIVNETETLTGTSSEFSLQSENDDSRLVSLVQGCELFAELSSGQVGSGGVEDGEYELFSVE
jgi:hypothetical protein